MTTAPAVVRLLKRLAGKRRPAKHDHEIVYEGLERVRREMAEICDRDVEMGWAPAEFPPHLRSLEAFEAHRRRSTVDDVCPRGETADAPALEAGSRLSPVTGLGAAGSTPAAGTTSKS